MRKRSFSFQVAVLNPFAAFFASPRFRLGWILLAIGLANAVFWTAFRWKWENGFLQTQITLDFEDSRSLSDAYNITQKRFLTDFRAQGANSLALYNQTLVTLRDNGRLAITPREVAERQFYGLDWRKIPADYRYLVTSSDEKLLTQIFPRLSEQSATIPIRRMDLNARARNTPSSAFKPPPIPIQSAFLIPASKQLLNDAALGFDPQHIQIARENDYQVVARISNPLNLTPARLKLLFDDVEEAGAKVVLFSGDEVVGYDTLISPVAREMRRRGLLFSNIEFSKQSGTGDFAKNTEGALVRVHSVEGSEASRLEPEMFVDRFVRAVKERNMRVIYVRLPRQLKGEPTEIAPGDLNAPLEIKEAPYQQNLKILGQISEGIQRAPLPGGVFRPGLQLGAAQPFSNYPTSVLEPTLGATGARITRYLMLFLSGVGVVGATLLLLNLFWDWSARAQKLWLWGGLILVAGLSISQGKGAQIIALQAGWTLPIIAVLWGGLPLIWDGLLRPSSDRTPSQITLFGFKILWRTTLLTLIGGFLITALLNEWRYMGKADEFLGEKATQYLPLLILPLVFLGELFPYRVEAEGAARGRKLALQRASDALAQPFTARIALICVLVLGGGYVWMARSGNDSGMQISGLELQARAFLEQVFVTRPRTKEIIVGHPAFLLAVFFALRRQKLLALGALVPAIVGQADVVNTMCHIHTPVFFNLWRSLTSIFIGTAFGFLAVLVAFRLFPRSAPKETFARQNGVPEPVNR